MIDRATKHFGHWKHPVFRQSFANVTAIARDSLGNQYFWPLEAPSVSSIVANVTAIARDSLGNQ
jgi:hypothetical protein